MQSEYDLFHLHGMYLNGMYWNKDDDDDDNNNNNNFKWNSQKIV
jgi:hypothetical protein